MRRLCGTQGEQRDLWRHAQPDRRATSAGAAIHVERGAPGSRSQWAVRRKRALIQSGGVVGNEFRRADAVIEDLDFDLAAVGVAGKSQLNAQLARPRKRIGIV